MLYLSSKQGDGYGNEIIGSFEYVLGKGGTKRHILVDERRAPLSIAVTGTNRNDVTQI